MMFFGQKLLHTQCSVDRCAHKSPIMKRANMLRLFTKFTEAEHSLYKLHTDTDGFLEHSPSWGGGLHYKGPALQKIIPFGGLPLVYVCPVCMMYM